VKFFYPTHLFFALILIQGSFLSFSQSDLQKENLQGKVKTVKESEYDVVSDGSGGIAKIGQTRLNEFEFNESGNITGWADINFNGGMVSWYFLNEYSDSGYLSTQTYFGGDNSKMLTYYHFFNSAGQETQWYMQNLEDSVTYEWLNTYDKRGNLIRSESFKPRGKPDRRYEYKYNKKGYRISEKWYDAAGNCTNITKSKYDEWGNEIFVIRMDGEKNITNKWIQKFNADGRMIEMTRYKSKTEFEQRCTYAYDAFGNQTEIKMYTATDSLIGTWSYTYEYDEQHNWMVRIKLYDGQPLKSTERIIGYYD